MPGSDSLQKYRQKRSLDRTPEPSGRPGRTPSGHLYVMHQHAARRLHWDLRLELDGVLKSWAVPKGPSYDQANKQLAVHVEDHPVEYGDFEGVIPEGNYGAGAVIVWDRGVWVPIEDPVQGLEKGKLLFELRGQKLHGRWTLVKMKKTENDWLLIKERDAFMKAGPDDFPPDSVLSGLTVEEMARGSDKAAEIREALEDADAPRRTLSVSDIQVMLAETREQPFSDPDWVFEVKYDGYRFLAGRAGEDVQLLTRTHRDGAARFPDLVLALRALPFERFVADGEVVVHDERGLPNFQRLQRRAQLSRALDIQRAAVELPATYYLFDLLAFDGYDLRSLPLVERKRLLRTMLPTVGPLRYADHIAERGAELYAAAGDLHLEGIMAKKAASPYRGGRSRDWLKIRLVRTDDFVVVGYTQPRGTRDGFGSLHLAQYRDGALTYAGNVGSGFSTQQLEDTHRDLEEHRIAEPAFVGAPTGVGHTWVKPERVAEVRYTERTDEGLLRHPVFLRFREDKPPADCIWRDASPAPAHEPGGVEEFPDVEVTASPRAVERNVALSNLDKVFWPDERYTKGDMIEYYRAVGPWLLPYLADRPLVLTRFPDGIEGKSFFQKDAPGFAPDWIHTETIWSDQSQRELNYFVCDDVDTLIYVANSASIPLHIWASRISSLERPDWSIIDLDPKGAPFVDVVEVALTLRALCEAIELPCYVKTSGSSGLHVLVPLGRQCTHEQARLLAELLARLAVAELPERATIARVISKREGKVYLDYLQNGHGKLLVAPFSVRPLPGAPVSAPLEWREVNRRLDIRRYTIRSMPRRMSQKKRDPLHGVLEDRPDLVSALSRLQARSSARERR